MASDELFVVRADVGEGAVLHAEAARNGSELGEAKTLVEMPRVDVAFDHGVELEDAEPVLLRLCKAVKDELFADVPPTALRADIYIMMELSAFRKSGKLSIPDGRRMSCSPLFHPHTQEE